MVFSADLLLLHKSNAVAFLPLLNSILGEDNLISNGIEVGLKNSPSSSNTSTTTEMKREENSSNGYNSEGGELLRGWNQEDNDEKSSSISNLTSNFSHPSIEKMETLENDHVEDYDNNEKNKQTWDNNDLLTPFVESLILGAGFQCLILWSR